MAKSLALQRVTRLHGHGYSALQSHGPGYRALHGYTATVTARYTVTRPRLQRVTRLYDHGYSALHSYTATVTVRYTVTCYTVTRPRSQHLTRLHGHGYSALHSFEATVTAGRSCRQREAFPCCRQDGLIHVVVSYRSSHLSGK